MLLNELKMVYLREVSTLERELELYPDDTSVWTELPGLPNSAGSLFLHRAGILQHFFGATLGKTGYIRDRQREFSRRDLPRSELRQELAGARHGVMAAFGQMNERDLERPFPVIFADVEFSVRLTLIQFQSHLAYHLGQIDYHRRTVTQNRASAKAMDPMDLLP